jgi:hypothetical protein
MTPGPPTAPAMRDDLPARPEDDPEFLELRRLFVRDARRNAGEMASLLAVGPGLPAGEPGLRFRKLSHDLRGTGGSYGFPIITLFAGEAEDTYLERGHPDALRAIVGMLEGAILQAGGLVGAGDLPSS